MPGKRRKIFFAIPFLLIIAVLFLGFLVMLLWNFVFPPVLHTATISYWQAVALLILCRILFFGFRRYSKDYHSKMWRNSGPPWRQKWMNMSDEERTKFREEWKQRCKKPE